MLRGTQTDPTRKTREEIPSVHRMVRLNSVLASRLHVTSPLLYRESPTLNAGTKLEMATKPSQSVPHAQRKIRNGYFNHAVLGATYGQGRHITLLSWGTQTLGAGTKSEIATSPLLSRAPTCGLIGYIAPAISGIPNAQRSDKIRHGYITPAIWGVPNAQCGDKIRNGKVTLAILGVHMCVKWLHNPCLGGPQCEDKIRSSYMPLLSQVP